MSLSVPKYRLFQPCEQLQPFIKAFAIQGTIDERIYQVLPDTALVIGFQYQGSLSWMCENEEIVLTPFGITGILDNMRRFKNTGNTGSILIFFKDGGAAAFFDQPLHEISGHSLSLECLISIFELKIIQEQLQEARTDAVRISVIEKFLITKMHTAKPDELITTAIRLIRASEGSIRIDQLCKQLHTSKSPLEKRFRKIAGTSPKKFASLVRFRSVLTLNKEHLTMTEMAYRAGYYDQAHFINQFKAYTGDSPEKFFAGGV